MKLVKLPIGNFQLLITKERKDYRRRTKSYGVREKKYKDTLFYEVVLFGQYIGSRASLSEAEKLRKFILEQVYE